MSYCVKSSVLRRLAEQKGQKSMLIKGCGQLLACGFALIEAKCSCSQKTLHIYLSNSAHWLWVRPVGLVASGALTKKSQHFLQRYEVGIWARVCVCVRARLCVFVCMIAYVSVTLQRPSLWPPGAHGCFFHWLCRVNVHAETHTHAHLQVIVWSH